MSGGIRVLVCGGRDFDDAKAVWDTLDKLNENDGISCVIHGGARGADTLADLWGRMYDVDCEKYEANWKQHGKAAGPIRNKEMLDNGKPDLVLAFPGGRGTQNMIKQATDANVKVKRK